MQYRTADFGGVLQWIKCYDGSYLVDLIFVEDFLEMCDALQAVPELILTKSAPVWRQHRPHTENMP